MYAMKHELSLKVDYNFPSAVHANVSRILASLVIRTDTEFSKYGGASKRFVIYENTTRVIDYATKYSLLKFYIKNKNFFFLDSSVIMPFSWCVVAVTLPK